jgi:hypothetical protein
MFPILNKTEEDFGVGLDTQIVPDRPETLLGPASQAIADYIPKVTESLQDAIGPIAQVPGLLAEGAYEPVNKVLTGQPLQFMDMPVVGVGGAGANAAVKGGLTTAQQALGITRRTRIMDTAGTQGFYGPGSSTAEKIVRWRGKGQHSDKEVAKRLDWYKSGQLPQLTLMGTEVMNTLARTLFSPKNDKLLNRYGIAPHIAEDYRRMFDLEDEMVDAGKKVKWQNKDQLYNEMLSQLKYNLDVMIRRDPDSVPEIANLFYANKTATTAKDLSLSGLPIKKLFGNELDMPTNAVRDHISEFAAKSGTFGDKTIQMSGTRFSHLPTSMMYGPSAINDNSTGRMAYDVIRKMSDDTPRTMDNIINTARNNEFGRSINISQLMEDSVDSGGYISFGGRSLGQDRQFGNYDWRLIIDKKTGEGYMVMMDEMKLGMKSKMVNNALQYGGDESLAIDIVKLDNRLEAKGPSITPAVGHKEASPIVRDYVEQAQADPPTPAEQLQFMLKRAGQAVAGIEGGRLAGYVFKKIPFEGNQSLEGDASP